MNLHSLIEAIGISVSKAQQGIEQHSIERFFDYFKDPNTAMPASSGNTNSIPQGFEPITAKVVMPCSDNINRTAPAEIPLVALAHHRQVHLDKITFKVRTRLTSDNSGSIMADINAPVLNTANSLEEPETDQVNGTGEIELVFNVTDSAEGISRVVQNISKTI
ncbi:MAG: DUF2589 domain-containing protein [Oscillospiraceae bacterium]|nr:DUF2589 domain-containing protein [Oscillospiraceae bacterium]